MSRIRSIITQTSRCHFSTQCENYVMKPFHEIPGPSSYPIIGSSWKYMPLIGDWDVKRLHLAGIKRLEEFGSIVREEVSPGTNFVHVYTPEDIEKVYKSEGRFPERRDHLALMHYRLSRPHLYNNGGLLPTNGDEWWRVRFAFQRHLSRINEVRKFLPASGEIINEFLKPLSTTTIEDFSPIISRLYLELMWKFIFGNRLHSFDPVNMSDDSIPSKLIKAGDAYTENTLITDNTEKIWKKIKTRPYKIMEESLSYIENISLQALEKANAVSCKANKKTEDMSLVDKFFESPTIDTKDINAMTADLVLGGIDTTAYTTSFLLYNLSRNRGAQEKLFAEAKALLPSQDSKITDEVLSKAHYARAIMKESLRLNPVAVGISRYLQEDSVFSDYFVPKGTLMLTQNLVACRKEENFKNPLSFIPERWIRGSPEYKNVSPYLVLPFSHGPRACIARWLAEQNILSVLISIGRKYSISWRGEGLDIVTPLICKTDRPVKISFHSWEK